MFNLPCLDCYGCFLYMHCNIYDLLTCQLINVCTYSQDLWLDLVFMSTSEKVLLSSISFGSSSSYFLACVAACNITDVEDAYWTLIAILFRAGENNSSKIFAIVSKR